MSTLTKKEKSMRYIFKCNWPPVSVEMTIPKSQQLCTEVQVGMSQEAQEQPEEVSWCLTETSLVNQYRQNVTL